MKNFNDALRATRGFIAGAVMAVLAIGVGSYLANLPVLAASGSREPGYATKVVTLRSSAALTSQGNATTQTVGSFISTINATLPLLQLGFTHGLTAQLDVTAASSSGLVTIEGRACSTCTPFTMYPASGSFATIITSTRSVGLSYPGPIPPEVRYRAVTVSTGNADTYTFSITAVLGGT